VHRKRLCYGSFPNAHDNLNADNGSGAITYTWVQLAGLVPAEQNHLPVWAVRTLSLEGRMMIPQLFVGLLRATSNYVMEMVLLSLP